jgi:hypothetical protein
MDLAQHRYIEIVPSGSASLGAASFVTQNSWRWRARHEQKIHLDPESGGVSA